jgi:tRNA 2-thiouridine synthesizing protein A
MTEKTFDLRGLKCPLPVLRTRKALASLARGDVLVVTCTDPLAGIDIPNLLRRWKRPATRHVCSPFGSGRVRAKFPSS